MDVLYCYTDLGQPVKNLILGEIDSFGLFYNFSQITSIGILHDNIEITIGFEKGVELDNETMI